MEKLNLNSYQREKSLKIKVKTQLKYSEYLNNHICLISNYNGLLAYTENDDKITTKIYDTPNK